MNNEKAPASKSYHDYLIESLKDSTEAAAYLEVTLEQKEPELLSLALKHLLEARSGAVAQNLSETPQPSKPTVESLLEQEVTGIYKLAELLDSLGLQLAVIPKQQTYDEPLAG